MSLANAALYLTVFLYLIVSVGYYRSGKYGLSVTFLCYSIANLGIIMTGGD